MTNTATLKDDVAALRWAIGDWAIWRGEGRQWRAEDGEWHREVFELDEGWAARNALTALDRIEAALDGSP